MSKEEPIEPHGDMPCVVTTGESADGEPLVTLYVTESYGTINPFPLTPGTARLLGNLLIEKADALSG